MSESKCKQSVEKKKTASVRKKEKGILNKAKTASVNFAINKVLIHRGRQAVHDLDLSSRKAVQISEKLLMHLLDKNKDTEYGRKYGFSEIHSIEDYKNRVPLSDYDEYEPYISRMVKKNEQGLIMRDIPKHYALSSGSVGVPKHIPVSAEELAIYKKYGTSMLFGVMDEYYRNTTGKSFKTGFGVNTLELKFSETPFNIPKGAISGNILKQDKDILPYLLSPPWDVIAPKEDMDLKYLRARFTLEREDISFLDGAFMTSLVDLVDYICNNWKMLCKDIRYGRISEDADVPGNIREALEAELMPNPKRAKALAAEFRKGFKGILPRIWPDLQFVGSIGTGGFFTYTKKMIRYTGRNIPFEHLSYAASEGLFATARHPFDTFYVLIPESGFYEFIPERSDDDTGTLTIDELEEGEKYEIIITNLSGLYRYRIKDVIRVIGFYNEAPLVQFIYRKGQMLSIAGEKTNQDAVQWAVEQFMKETGVIVNDYSIYADTDTEPGHYAFIIEPEEIVPEDKIEEYRDVIEAKMSHANPSYGDKIRTGVLAKTELIFVQKQTYQLYRDMMIMKGTSPNQLKPVRVIDTPIKKRFFFGLRERY